MTRLALTEGRIKLDLVTWTAATNLVVLDATKLTDSERHKAIDAALALVGRLNSTAKLS